MGLSQLLEFGGSSNNPVFGSASGPIETPFLRLQMSGNRTFWIKNEADQHGGSFKFRGPSAFLARNKVKSGVVTTASTGNHAIGLSLAASNRNLVARIFVPTSTPERKLSAIRAAGGEITMVDGDYEEALRRAELFAKDQDAVLVPSYDHDDIIAGNQQVFEEIKNTLDTTQKPVFVPIGGGGILSAAIRSFDKMNTSIIGVELDSHIRTSKIVWDGLKEIELEHAQPEPSTEGIAIRCLGRIPQDTIRTARNLRLESVDVTELKTACRMLWSELGIRAELGGCASFACALRLIGSEHIGNEAICVVTGGNIDPVLHENILLSQNT